MTPLIVFGGSFDPVHNGHLRIAKAASSFYDGAPVLFIPAKAPRWKKTDESTSDRIAMLERALSETGDPRFSLDLREIHRPGEVSYSIDTIEELREENPDRPLILLVGADTLSRFHEWKDAKEIARLAKIVYSPRPGYNENLDNVREYGMIRLPFEDSGPVSSSDLKRLRSADLPLSVRDYIEEKRLYYVRDIFERLLEKRALHSLSVARLSEKVVESNRLASLKGKGYIAGALHDLAKPLSDKEGRRLSSLYTPACGDLMEIPPYAVHAYAGAYIAEHDFGIRDPEILDAIAYHCTGRRGMSALEKIVYACDKIEPLRGYDSSYMIERMLYDYEAGFRLVLKENRDFLERKKSFPTLDKRSEECFEEYLGGENG